jgi:hypothetical protein
VAGCLEVIHVCFGIGEFFWFPSLLACAMTCYEATTTHGHTHSHTYYTYTYTHTLRTQIMANST